MTKRRPEYESVLARAIDESNILVWNKWRAKHPGIPINLRGCELSGRDLTEIDFGGVDLSRAVLSGSTLRRAILSRSCLDGADLFGAVCDNISASGASFRRAILCYSVLSHSDLSACDLRGADLRHAVLTGANIRNARVAGAHLQGVYCDYVYTDAEWHRRLPARRILQQGELALLLRHAGSTEVLCSRVATRERQVGHAFVSYVQDDAKTVLKLVEDLEARGIEVWVDRSRLGPGVRWQKAVREAILKGTRFIACFSRRYWSRDMTYMNEELVIARQQMRKMRGDRAWFIPVRLCRCEIPDLEIGAGETLRDLQWVDLWKNWKKGVAQIVQSLADL